jgi:sugar phosphate isomerase/epimerase
LRDSTGADTADFKQQLELTPGKGSVDFGRYAEWLDSHGYIGNVTIETEYVGKTIEQIEPELDFAFKHLAANGWQFPKGVAVG